MVVKDDWNNIGISALLAKDTVTVLATVAHPTLYITVFKNEIPGLCCNTLIRKINLAVQKLMNQRLGNSRGRLYLHPPTRNTFYKEHFEDGFSKKHLKLSYIMQHYYIWLCKIYI